MTVQTEQATRVDIAQARPAPRIMNHVFSILGILITVGVIYMLITNERFQWEVVFAWVATETVLYGVLMTILLTAVAMTLGVFFGAVLALVRLSDNVVLSTMANGYVWFFRAIPQLVQILFWFNLAALFPSISITLPFIGEIGSLDTNSLITPLSAAIIALSAIEAAYMAEVIRGGLHSVNPGQNEAARALGMSPSRTLTRVVAPQVLRVILPPLGSNTIRMVKGTALVSVIGMNDLLHSVTAVYSQTYEVIPLLVVACIWYLIINSVLYVAQEVGERMLSKGRNPSRGRARTAPAATQKLSAETRGEIV